MKESSTGRRVPLARAAGRAVARILGFALCVLGWAGPLHAGPGGAEARAAISFDQGLLSMEVEDSPWVRVRQEWQRATGIGLHVVGSPGGTVTLSFRKLTLGEALKRLFGEAASFIYVYEVARREGSVDTRVPAEIWVLRGPPPPGAPSTPTPPSPVMPVDQPAASRSVLSPASGVDAKTIAELVITLRHEDPELREEAVEALSAHGEEAIDPLRFVLRSDVDARARAAAATALARIGTPRALRAFRQVLRDRDVEVRSQAVEAIAGETSDEAIVILREAQKDPNEHVRRTAVDALEALEDMEP